MQLKQYILSLAAASMAAAAPTHVEVRQSGGTGPYPAKYSTDGSLQSHTIYAPQNPPAGVKMPVLVWGNGACSANGLSQAAFLTQIASFGFLVIASGGPNQGGSTNSGMMKASIDWATTRPNNKWNNVEIDSTKVAAAGFSCGGVEAYDMKGDARVTTLGIFNSGLLSNTQAISSNRKTTFYFLGGSSDIAYQNGERDYRGLPAGVASWKGNQNTGHGATYDRPNGGSFAIAAAKWLQFVLQGNSEAATWFKGNGAQQAGWAVEKKNLDSIKVGA